MKAREQRAFFIPAYNVAVVSMSRARCALMAAFAAATVLGSTSCLVISLNRFADDAGVSFDEHVLGTWRDADDDVVVTFERSDWQSYRVSYVHPIATGQLTAYLFKSGGALYMDLMPVRGQDPGVFTIVGHTLVRVQRDGSTMQVWPLAYDWFRQALDAGRTVPDLALVRNERDQLVATADAEHLRQWLRDRPSDDPAFGPVATFTRDETPPAAAR